MEVFENVTGWLLRETTQLQHSTLCSAITQDGLAEQKAPPASPHNNPNTTTLIQPRSLDLIAWRFSGRVCSSSQLVAK